MADATLEQINESTRKYIKESNATQDAVTVPMTAIAINVPIALAQAGVPGKSWYISYANWRVNGSQAVGSSNLLVTMKDGDTVVYNSVIAAGSVVGTNLSIAFTAPIKITEGNAVTYSIAASGNPGCSIFANLGLILK